MTGSPIASGMLVDASTFILSGGNVLSSTGGVIGSLRSANMNTTADQAITITPGVWMPTQILVTNASASLTLSVGGVYPAASKGGTPIVAAAQAYSALTGSSILLPLTLSAGALSTRYTIGTIYLSLTTGLGSAATVDVYVIGVNLT